ncbi:MAG: hypothetical protein HOP11_08850 [Saprospiraceae bacterium]|nr:hypothetical protein [Saprospiraceae bacterium]
MKIYFNLLLLTMLLNSCCKDCGEGCAQILNAFEINFYCLVYDKNTKESIIGNCLACPYSEIGSVLIDSHGDTIRNEGTINSGGEMLFPLIKKGRDSVNYPIHQEYFLHLVDFNGIEQDVDTISFDFTLINSDRCEKFDYKDFRCYYNDSLYLTEYKWYKEGGRVIFYK